MYIIKNISADYLSIADIDTEFPVDYFNKMLIFMEDNPDVGVSSGRIEGYPHSMMRVPMGLGKVVRWDVLLSFEKYWDLAPDSFLNIKAENLGYRLAIRDEFVKSAPMTIHSKKGRFRYGRRSYYIRKNPVLVLFEALNFLLAHQHGSQFLRGYWFEWKKGNWQCDDIDIRYYFSMKRQVHLILKKMKLS